MMATSVFHLAGVEQCVIAVDDSKSTVRDVGVTIDLLENDTVKAGSGCEIGDVTVELIGAPAGATLNANKTVTYINAVAGTYIFDYRICCDNTCDTATVTVQVLTLPDNITSSDCYVDALASE